MDLGPLPLFGVLLLPLLGLAAWSLRPSQPRRVSPRAFALGGRDPLFRLLFDAEGRPRRYAWCVPVAGGVLMLIGAGLAWWVVTH
jgi:hypothetical protein